MARNMGKMFKFDFVVSNGDQCRGMRDFLKNTLPAFAREHKDLQFNVIHKYRIQKNPNMTIHFTNGRKYTYSMINMGAQEFFKIIKKYQDRPYMFDSKQRRWRGPQTNSPSIQGVWSAEMTRQFPYVHTDPTVAPGTMYE